MLPAAERVVGRSNDTVEVVMEWAGSDPYVTRNVPRSWDEYIQRVTAVGERLNRRFRNDSDIFGFEMAKGDLNRGGKSAPMLEARVRSGSNADRRVPDKEDGVPIRTNEIEDRQITLLGHKKGCYNDNNMNELWGGLNIQTTHDEDGLVDQFGTSMATARANGTEYAVTANHLFAPGAQCDSNWDDEAWQHEVSPDQLIGDVSKYNQTMDYAILELEDLGPKYDVYGAKWSGGVVSHAGQTRIAELVESTETVEMMGTSTGGTEGELTKNNVDVQDDCIDTNSNAFQCSSNVAQGDSGGPVYTLSESGSGITMIGLVSGTRNRFATCGENCDGNGIYCSFFGIPAWHMSNKWGLEFNSP